VDTIGVRALDNTRGLLNDPTRGGSFTLSNINWIKGLPTIDLFHPALEGQPHNNAHVVTGAMASGKNGHMYSGLSPLDPIFWLHHCMVDRVWAEWQHAGHTTTDPGTDYAGQFFEPDGSPARATSTGAMDIATMGYTYDVLLASVANITATPDLRSVTGPLSPQTLDALRNLLKPRPPEILGSGANKQSSVAKIATTIPVSIASLPERATGDLALQNLDGLAPRYIARLSNVVPPEGVSDVLVNVFVECPYLSPETPYDDPYYAGTFSFFGHPQATEAMPDMKRTREFIVDITGAMQTLAREGRLKSTDLKIQLMPIPAVPGGTSEATFQVQQVEVIRT
jgi:tyrosinase